MFNNVSVLDNVRIAFYSQIRSGLLETLIHARRVVEEDRAFTHEAMRLLDMFNVQRYAHELAGNLPYGDQRRVEMVRALATRPRLLLLDEPAAGMNPNEIDHLTDLIHYIRDEFHLTIVLIEHQMRLVMRICERIKVLHFGETIAEGTRDDIRTNPRVLKAYLGEGAE